MNFFGHSSSSGGGGGGGLGGGRGANEVPFSIDDAFDIPEDDDVLAGASAGATASNSAAASSSSSAPIIRNGQLRLSSDGDASYAVPVGAAEGEGGAADGASTDSASLIQSGEGGGGGRGGGGGGYYEGPPQLKYWWLHPKIRSNVRVVVAACMLVVLGLGESTGSPFPRPSALLKVLYFLLLLLPLRADSLWHCGVLHPDVQGHPGHRVCHRRRHLLRARGVSHRVRVPGREGQEGVRVQPLAPLQQLSEVESDVATTSSPRCTTENRNIV